MEAQSFRELIIQNMYSTEKCIDERTHHDQDTQRRMDERKLHMQECKVTEVKAIDASLVYTGSNRTVSGIQNVNNNFRNEYSKKENENNVSGNGNNSLWTKSSKSEIRSSKSGNNTKVDAAYNRPTYDIDSVEHVPNDEYNVFAMEKEHHEQPESINDTNVVE
nr:hypothetical protein [Tanacetum cinerariifolium]